jgi:hypothetical protein
MSTEAYVLYAVTIVLLVFSLIKSKEKTKMGLIKGAIVFIYWHSISFDHT